MCVYQVPPKLKAALFDTVGAFAREMASAVKIWCGLRTAGHLLTLTARTELKSVACFSVRRAYLDRAAVIQRPPADAGLYVQDAHAFAALGTRTDILYQV